LSEFTTLAAISNAKNVHLLDCGVTGGGKVSEGGLVCFLGGSPEVVERIMPVLNCFSRKVLHMGPLGTGMVAKIARNVLVYTTWRAEHEAMSLASAAGVDVPKLIEAIEISSDAIGGACFWARRDPAGMNRVDGQFRDASAKVLDKDLTAAIALAETVDIQIPMAELAKATGDQMVRWTAKKLSQGSGR
jgi:3-hydroxyisobutyrate dehydrogenase